MALIYKVHIQGGSDNTAPIPHNHILSAIPWDSVLPPSDIQTSWLIFKELRYAKDHLVLSLSTPLPWVSPNDNGNTQKHWWVEEEKEEEEWVSSKLDIALLAA